MVEDENPERVECLRVCFPLDSLSEVPHFRLHLDGLPFFTTKPDYEDRPFASRQRQWMVRAQCESCVSNRIAQQFFGIIVCPAETAKPSQLN
jgi:hypothetical protein